jgi:hypothetical protein
MNVDERNTEKKGRRKVGQFHHSTEDSKGMFSRKNGGKHCEIGVEEKWVNSTTAAPKTIILCFLEKIHVEEENTVK